MAKTIRPKIMGRLNEFLSDTEISCLANRSDSLAGCESVDWTQAVNSLQIDRNVPEVKHILPGSRLAQSTFDRFISERIKLYAEKNNDPNVDALSNMSP